MSPAAPPQNPGTDNHTTLRPRRFALVRQHDPSGISGTGTVAHGVLFDDGSICLRWHSCHPCTTLWNSLADLLAVHGHHGATTVQWIDPHTTPARPAATYPDPTRSAGRHRAATAALRASELDR